MIAVIAVAGPVTVMAVVRGVIGVIFKTGMRPMMMAMGQIRIVRRLSALLQPGAHHLHFSSLVGGDPLAQPAHAVMGAARLQQSDHLHRLGVVGDHVLHEDDVRLHEARPAERHRFVRRNFARGLSRSARLKDRGRFTGCAHSCNASQKQEKTNHFRGLPRHNPLRAWAPQRLRASAN